MILNINKPLGLTSYDVIRSLKKKYPGEKIGHAGTLDPLAEGVLICLVGKDSTKRQNEFMGVNKEYEYEMLFGFDTDTYDILGKVKDYKGYKTEVIMQAALENLSSGKISQKLPPFSASKIKGKPLYRWYLDGRINEVEIPVKDIEVVEHEVLSSRIVSKSDLKLEIQNLVNKVDSRFRKMQVLESWNGAFDKTQQKEFLLVRAKALVSKGAYIRALAHDLGEKIGIPAATLTIKRTKVGGVKIENSIDLSQL